MNKNPFEIRLEVLKMAQDMALAQQDQAMNTYWNTINSLAETWNKSAEDLVILTKEMQPEMYTPADVMKKAKELYTFVCSKE